MADAFNAIIQERIPAPVANTWTAVVIPVGSRNALIGIEDPTQSFRLSYDNSVDPSTDGIFVSTGGFYFMEGVNSIPLTFYISVTGATNIILQYTNE